MDIVSSTGKILVIFQNIIDILVIAFLIYQGYKILLHTKAMYLIKSGLVIATLYIAAYFLKLETLLWLMDKLGTVLIIVIVIVFQPEIRNFFTRIGRGKFFSFSSISKIQEIDSVLNAAEILSSMKRGAIIVFARQIGLKNIIETGTKLNADISSNLIVTIFEKDTSLHDGAVIINGNKIVAAACFLPLSEQIDIKRSFGTRHRAALGISETTDAVVLVVSEETRAISVVFDGTLYYNLNKDELKKTLNKFLSIKEEPAKREKEKEEVKVGN